MNRKPRLILAVVIALAGLFSYYGMREQNPVTGEMQSVAGITPSQEVALGLQSAPQMAAQFGGLDPDRNAVSLVARVGSGLASRSAASQTPYQFDFHLLADARTVNAFALPGGQIFITRALLDRLENEAQLAGVLGHEAGHVVARHGAEHIAKSQLSQLLVGAAGVAASDPNDPNQARQVSQIAAFAAQMANLKYGREDELEADTLGVRFMSEAGYDPRALIEVMKILEQAGGGGRSPEFLSSHPNPGNREEVIRVEIEKRFPDGVPTNLTEGAPFGRSR